MMKIYQFELNINLGCSIEAESEDEAFELANTLSLGDWQPYGSWDVDDIELVGEYEKETTNEESTKQ